MVGDCIGNVWGMCGGVMGYCWDGFGWKEGSQGYGYGQGSQWYSNMILKGCYEEWLRKVWDCKGWLDEDAM